VTQWIRPILKSFREVVGLTGPKSIASKNALWTPTKGRRIELPEFAAVQDKSKASHRAFTAIYGISKSKRKKVARTFIRSSLVLGLLYGTALGGSIAGRDVPVPLYGVTLDDVSKPTPEGNSLAHVAHRPAVRIVFDPRTDASYYVKPIQQFRSVAYIMGELADSSYMRQYTASSIKTWTQNYTAALGNLVDIWEIGNEVNGDWLGSNTMAKIEAMYDVVASQDGATALTFFYEGEPSDPHNCISTDNGGNDMFTWIAQQFRLNQPTSQRSVETEKIRLNVNYVLISWYPDQCPGENPNWPWVYTKLAGIFPKSKVGFGELGTAHPQYGSSYEIDEINQYYPMAKTVAGLPASYIGGYFWWYFAEEMVPWGTTLSNVLNAAIQ
jgi:hypothetical protein